jgi:hypothetical protein
MTQFFNGLSKGFSGGIRNLPQVFRALLGLPRQIIEFIRLLFQLLRRRRRREGECEEEIRVPADTYKRADPLLYSQSFLMKMGLAVTWDNPDIQLYRDGSPVSSSQLEPGREYEVVVQVWNNSYDAPAAGLAVFLSFLSFGVGTVSTFIGKTLIDLGVKGSSLCPAFAHFTWRTPDTPGHYCLQARLDWPDDANPDNNLGQENTNVAKLQSPAHFLFRLRNRAAVERRFIFEADDYRLPEPEPCPPPEQEQDDRRRPPSRLEESRQRWAKALQEQGYGLFRPADDWSIHIEPEKEVLAPFEEIDVRVSIEPRSPGFSGRKAFNINAFSIGLREAKVFEGGVTLIVET